MRATRRPSSIALALIAAVVMALVVAGCGTSGRTLRDPIPGATAPPRKGATTSSTAGALLQTTPEVGLSISTTAWTPGGEIPRGYTCDGQSVSPPLTIAGAPAGSVELVVVVSDQDAAGFLQWVVAGIAPGAPSFPQGALPTGAIELPNSTGAMTWFGPCPPAGATHTYDFTAYALSTASGLNASSTPGQLESALETATSTAAMTGTYTRA